MSNNRLTLGESTMKRMLVLARNQYFSHRPIFSNVQQILHNSQRTIRLSPVTAVQLPRLPVPSLKKTLEKYLRTVKPHLNESEFKVTSELVNKFGSENGVGTKLQELLEKKAQGSQNWLEEWWLNTAYLDFRWPVVVHSSPGLVFPLQEFKGTKDRLSYATKLILAAIDYKLLIYKDKIPLEKMGKDPLDMSQYKRVFGTIRIPGLTRDSLEFHPESKHIVVAHKNNFFKLSIINDKNEVLNEQQVYKQLENILNKSSSAAEPVGILTTENRNNWGKTYQSLIRDSINKKSLEAINEALFLVCFDEPMPDLGAVNRQTVAGLQLVHGGGSRANAANRWYDKTIQFVIGVDGIVGLTYEHSPSEGQPIAVMTDHLVNYIEKNVSEKLPPATVVPDVTHLSFKVSSDVKAAIEAAKTALDSLVDDLDMNCFTFKSFGKGFVKSQKLSPDSFLQMAMQYAFYRIHKIPGAHYESAATRKFYNGRTETIRSCSQESIAFAKTMLDSAKSKSQKAAALKEAIEGHKQYTMEALNGLGVDRHLLGLKLTALENGMDVPKLYLDAGFVKSAHMRLSTSQVATKCDGFMCYGPLVADGYGCCYNPREDDMNFGISAFRSNPETSATKFREALEQSLLDMQDVLVKAGAKSKL